MQPGSELRPLGPCSQMMVDRGIALDFILEKFLARLAEPESNRGRPLRWFQSSPACRNRPESKQCRRDQRRD
jgi:hypothetical protein